MNPEEPSSNHADVEVDSKNPDLNQVQDLANDEKIAEEVNTRLKPKITNDSPLSWKQISEEVEHDELVYKLVLKYLRRDGFDIGSFETPQVTVKSN